ncbi:MAG: sensor histidine kinase [Polaribacter sp.]|uniref:tetratricopeptide repeat-containing sensor histidine kinase n=1 Tax=Polaribacter sp. TaxID=1920175 RepID=UPI002F356B7C
MKLRFTVVLFFIFFISHTSKSQNKRLDSLINLSLKVTDTLLISVLNDISWEYKNSNQDTALYFGKKALKKSKEINHKKAIAKSYNSIGNVFQAKSNKDSALYYHKKSLNLKIEIKDSIGIADTYNNLGIILDESGEYLEALKNYFSALKIYEEKSTSFDQVPAVLVNIGIVYKKQKKYDKVLAYYKRALKIYEENNFKIGIVITTGNIGSVLLKLNKNKEAITYCKKARKMYSDLGYKRYVPYMNVNIAAAEYNLKEYITSINRYLKVINDFNTDNNLYELSNAKIGISKPYTSINQLNKASKQLTEALSISRKNKFKEFEVDALKHLSEVNFKVKKFKQAYLFQEEYNSKKDRLFEKTKTKDINELLVKYETSKKEKEIVLQKEELLEKELSIKNRNIYAILLASALLILGIIFFAIYKKNQFKRKQLQKEIDLKDALSTIKTQNRLQEQRLRISRDLHDNIGSQLTFIISSIDNLKYVSKDVNTKLKDKLVSISSFTSETIHQLRDTIWAMNKSEITSEDLHARILSFVEKAKNATENISFEVSNTIVKSTSFSSLEGMNMFRVIQEAINNAIKYADASIIDIKLDKKENQFLISITDNGIGFDIKNITLGNGLSNIEKRMSEINGKATITSKVKKGTNITLSIFH